MDYLVLLQGLIIGFLIALPVGPIGILCIRKTAAEGHLAGMAVGLGAASADAVYGGIAGLGLTFVSNILISQQLWFRLIGGAFLLYLGIRTFLAKPVEISVQPNGRGLLGSFLSTFLLTLTNPLTILAFVGIFAALGLGDAVMSRGSAALLVLGVFLGSALWFLTLSSGITVFRKKINSVGLGLVNRISGALIVLFGIVAILSFR